MQNHTEHVRELFDNAEWYLKGWRHSIRIREETVRDLIRNRGYKRILDIGCGDGSISIPLLKPGVRLTLLDISGSMLANARHRVPAGLESNVEFVNQDFLEASLPVGYDLILCIGVFAHVGSPSAVVEKIGSLLAPGGCVIAESTDPDHVVTRISRVYSRVREKLTTPATYQLKALSAEQVTEMFAGQRLELSAMYRYSLPLPGMTRVLSEHSLYRLNRMLFGRYPNGKNAVLGNELIYQFQRTSEAL
ncbi:MAG: class I SAM-dependent methyltransferase [Candidatus Sulfotelmatobacter sp.]